MLNILCRKGKLTRTLVDRAYHYKPKVTRRKVVGSALRDLVRRAFGGDARAARGSVDRLRRRALF